MERETLGWDFCSCCFFCLFVGFPAKDKSAFQTGRRRRKETNWEPPRGGANETDGDAVTDDEDEEDATRDKDNVGENLRASPDQPARPARENPAAGATLPEAPPQDGDPDDRAEAAQEVEAVAAAVSRSLAASPEVPWLKGNGDFR